MGKTKKQQQQDELFGMAHWSGSAYSAAQFSAVTSPPTITSTKKGFFGGGAGSSLTNNVIPSSTHGEEPLQSIDYDDLRQGSLYIVKIRNVALSLFEGWDDDMCCFAILRSDSTPMRWSEARYIPGDFDAYDAFDEAGNPPVHLWTRQLRINVPVNWFSIFEEARRKQRTWMEEQNEEYYYPVDPELIQQQHYKHHQPISTSPPEMSPSPQSHHPSDEDITPPTTEKAASNDDQISDTSSHDHNNENDSLSSESNGVTRSIQDRPEAEDDVPSTEVQTAEEVKQQESALREPITTNKMAETKKQQEPKRTRQRAETNQQQESTDAKPKVPEPAVKTSAPSNKIVKERTNEGHEHMSSPVVAQGGSNETAPVVSMSRSSVSATKRTPHKKEFADNISPSPVLPHHPATKSTPTSPISSYPQLQQHPLPAISTTTASSSTGTSNKRASSLPVPAPLSPKLKYQSGPSSSVASSEQFFGETDFAFSHNADKFSIKNGYEIPPLPTVLPPQSKSYKKQTPVAQQGGEPLKLKRRSVQDLFRSKKDSRR